MIKAEYLGDKVYFENLDEAKNYYEHEEAETLEELNEVLSHEAEGMESPILTEIWV